MEQQLNSGTNEHQANICENAGNFENAYKFIPTKSKKNVGMNWNLDDLVAIGTIEADQAVFLKDIIKNKQNILIAGAIGAGKTVLLRALTSEVQQMLPTERVTLVQDSEEIKCQYENMTSLLNILNSTPLLGKIIGTALTMDIDRLIVGDLYGEGIREVLNSKTPFMASITGTTVNHALHNLEQFSITSGYTPLKSQIAEQANIVVLIEKIDGRHKVSNITQIMGWDEKHQIFEDIVLWKKQ